MVSEREANHTSRLVHHGKHPYEGRNQTLQSAVKSASWMLPSPVQGPWPFRVSWKELVSGLWRLRFLVATSIYGHLPWPSVDLKLRHVCTVDSFVGWHP